MNNQLIVKMVLDRWHAQLKNFNDTLERLTDDQLLLEVSPGRNRGIYLLGHLTAVHDAMIPLLDLGDLMYPDLAAPFLTSADKTVDNLPSAGELRKAWYHVNNELNAKIESLRENWFEKHTAVSDEDFAGEPHRNKLNIMLTRTTHLAYHLGQVRLLGRN